MRDAFYSGRLPAQFTPKRVPSVFATQSVSEDSHDATGDTTVGPKGHAAMTDIKPDERVRGVQLRLEAMKGVVGTMPCGLHPCQ
jgi:hypothetical protein